MFEPRVVIEETACTQIPMGACYSLLDAQKVFHNADSYIKAGLSSEFRDMFAVSNVRARLEMTVENKKYTVRCTSSLGDGSFTGLVNAFSANMPFEGSKELLNEHIKISEEQALMRTVYDDLVLDIGDRSLDPEAVLGEVSHVSDSEKEKLLRRENLNKAPLPRKSR